MKDMKKAILLFFTFVLTLFSLPVSADATADFDITLFYSQTCPHCGDAREFLEKLKEFYPDLLINEYEVINSQENQELLKNFYEKYGVLQSEMGYVPVIFTQKKYFVGFNNQIAGQLENCIEECERSEQSDTYALGSINLPVFGEINLSEMSLPVLTIILGALDGFNPCAMWVLLFLIALLLNTHSRKRMWIIGGTFVAASGIIYFLILAAWLNLFFAISYVNITRIIIGIFALLFGVWQIKEFFTKKAGVCKVTGGSASWQNKIGDSLKKKTETLALAPLNVGIVFGIIALAFGVNLVEFFCSAGLPAVFTKVLSMSELNVFSYYSYLLLYTIIFMLDDIIVFILAMVTLRTVNFTEKYSHWATLIGGLLILLIGLLLIFKPEILMFG
jgi:glutaredoxin